MAAACISCQKPLVLDVEDSDSDEPSSSSQRPDPKTVPDDVELPCGDHFHWQCLIDTFSGPACPVCAVNVVTADRSVVVTLSNEGGVQKDLDIGPLLAEEAYLRTHPGERRCRAFLELCREGDVGAVIGLLESCDDENDDDEEEGPRVPAVDVLRYQDGLAGGASGLHAAVAASSREIAWLLLLLASELPLEEFPALVFQEAAGLGVMRQDQHGRADIRSLKDAQGRTAEDIAAEVGGVWHGWVGSGRLALR